MEFLERLQKKSIFKKMADKEAKIILSSCCFCYESRDPKYVSLLVFSV